MTDKTQAIRILEATGVSFEIRHYSADETNAESVAKAIGASPDEVFKTLVAQRTAGKPMIVMVPANRNLNLKMLAKVVGEKKVRMASHAEAEQLTGLQTGGISAIVLVNKGFDIFLDTNAMKHEKIFISAGKRGTQLRLEVEDLISITKAKVHAVSG